MRYSTVFFDIDDTLIDFKKSEKIGLENCHASFFSHLVDFASFEKEYVRINRSLWKLVEQGTIVSSFVGNERFRQLSELFHIPHNLDCPRFYEEQLIQHSVLIEGAVDLLEHLQKKDIKIGFLTNGFARLQHSKYNKLNLRRFSDVLIISEEVGFSKPHPEIFRQALLAIGSEAKETLMVGDSIESDGKGAKLANMGFCWYTKEPHPLDWEPELIISDLKELIFAKE